MNSSTFSKDEENENILPYNYLAERLVLASIVTNPEAIFIVSEHLNVHAFYLKPHQILYKASLVLYGEGKSIDFITLTTWLQDNGYSQYIEDLSYIVDFLSQIITIAFLEDYIALIYEKYLRRLLIELGEEVVQAGYLTEIPLETLLEKIEEKFLILNFKKQKKLLKSSSEILSLVLNEIRQNIKTQNTQIFPGLPSCFIDLDALTQGFQKSDLIILAGRPSMGKTAFALTLAKNVAENSELGIAFFSLEMSQQQLLYRLLATESQISYAKLRSGRIIKEEWVDLNDCVDDLSELPIFIDDSPSISVSEMHFKIKRLKIG